jgi:hypothetical protein
LRNPRLILLSGAVVAGDLILSAGEARGNGDGDFSLAMRDVAGPTPAMGVALLATAQSISIAAAGTELLVSFGELRNSACASLMQFENAVLPALRAQCAGCHQASFFDARTDELVCQMMLTHSLPRDAGNSPILLRPQGAFGHPVIGLSTEERGAIRSWIETEAALR